MLSVCCLYAWSSQRWEGGGSPGIGARNSCESLLCGGWGNQTWDLCKNCPCSSPAPRILVKDPRKTFHVWDEDIIRVSEACWVCCYLPLPQRHLLKWPQLLMMKPLQMPPSVLPATPTPSLLSFLPLSSHCLSHKTLISLTKAGENAVWYNFMSHKSVPILSGRK